MKQRFSLANVRIARIIGALVMCILVLGALELLARAFGYPRRPYPLYPLDSELGWRMEPGSHELTPLAAAAQFVILGDSLAFMDADDRHSFTQALAHELELPIVNLSANGYGTDQEQLLLLKRFAPQLPHVKMVVLHFCLFNDFLDNLSHVNAVRGYPPKPYFEMANGTLTLHAEGIRFSSFAYLVHELRDKSGLYNGLRDFLVHTSLVERGGHPILPLHWAATDPAPNAQLWNQYLSLVRSAMPITRALIIELDRYVRESMHAELIVLVHPMSFGPEGLEPLELAPVFDEFFRSLPVNVDDLGCYFRKRSLTYAKVAFDRVGHLDGLGHKETAIYLARRFNGEIPEPSCRLSQEGAR